MARLSDSRRELGAEIVELTARKEAAELERDTQIKKRTFGFLRGTLQSILYGICQGPDVNFVALFV